MTNAPEKPLKPSAEHKKTTHLFTRAARSCDNIDPDVQVFILTYFFFIHLTAYVSPQTKPGGIRTDIQFVQGV